jgi:hypothetical protein
LLDLAPAFLDLRQERLRLFPRGDNDLVGDVVVAGDAHPILAGQIEDAAGNRLLECQR